MSTRYALERPAAGAARHGSVTLTAHGAPALPAAAPRSSKATASFVGYYKHALLYLACTPLATIPPAEQLQHAKDLALAALLGETLYNFGDLVRPRAGARALQPAMALTSRTGTRDRASRGRQLAHDILRALDGTEHAWLVSLLLAFSSGDLDAFQALYTQLMQQVTATALMFSSVCVDVWPNARDAHVRPERGAPRTPGRLPQPDLAAREAFLRQKISLMALVELVFRREAGDRRISFDTIAQHIRLPRDEVRQRASPPPPPPPPQSPAHPSAVRSICVAAVSHWLVRSSTCL